MRPGLEVWPPLPPSVYARRPWTELAFPLDGTEHILYSRARHALYNGLLALGLTPGDEVLAPAYHHGSEIETLVRLGLELRFYEPSATLEPDEDELHALVGPRTRALYLIHYLGFPQAAPRWRRWCDERGLSLVEDAAQAWLTTLDGTPVGSVGDLAIFCLYKTFGLPDGAALAGRALPDPAAGVPATAARPLLRRHAAWIASRSGRSAVLAEHVAGPKPAYSAAEDFALGNFGTKASRASIGLLPRVFDASAASRRRTNYAQLLADLQDRVQPPFDRLPDGASPFAFPLTVNDKAAVTRRLAEKNVKALDFWSVPHPSLPVGRFPRSARRRASIVGLPVHQELRPEDVERIASAVHGGARRRRRFNVDTTPALEPLREDWERLAERTQNIFATWDWASTWWRHFGREDALLSSTVRDRTGEAIGVLPLYRWLDRGLRVLRFIGHGAGDQLGPICAADDRSRVAQAFRQALRDGRLGWDLFVAEQLAGNEGWDALLGAKTLRWEGNPVVRVEPSKGWEGYLGTRSANFREQVRRRERKLAAEHEISFRLASDAERLDEDLSTLFRLHAARRPTGSSFTGRAAFHRDFARRALERNWLRLWFLDVDGEPRAAWYGFRFCGVESYYQSGRDPAWEKESVGFVLMAHSIRAALADGVAEYRLLRGGEAFKYRFATHDPGLETIGLARGALGVAALAGTGLAPPSLVSRWRP